MHTEVDTLEITNTWDVTRLPPCKKVLGNKWIYSNKYNANGTFDWRKARLDVLGNNQIEGEDFKDTFTSMAKL